MKKKYYQDFKLENVNLLLKDNRPVAVVVNELEIHLNKFHKWIHQVRNYEDQAFPVSDNLKPEFEELRKLKRKIANLKEENAILKKATAIFVKYQK